MSTLKLLHITNSLVMFSGDVGVFLSTVVSSFVSSCIMSRPLSKARRNEILSLHQSLL